MRLTDTAMIAQPRPPHKLHAHTSVHRDGPSKLDIASKARWPVVGL